MIAGRCPENHVSYPSHPRCPTCGATVDDTVDLADERAEVVTWTGARATPPGVRSPNRVAIVTFDVGDGVRAIGGTTDAVAVGDTVRPVYVAELRDPDAGIRAAESQCWDGYRYEPID
ncbi:nucleic acid-binding protein [Halobacteriales archaeon SW_7_68_16]|nr:MAG: nucleic acid-binding protein [Halobacteriales archaeon SW_7_68_16]